MERKGRGQDYHEVYNDGDDDGKGGSKGEVLMIVFLSISAY